MNSYVKYMASDCGHYDSPWYRALIGGTFQSYLNGLTPMDQLRYILDQTLILSIFFYLYGPEAHLMALTYSKSIKDYTDNRLDQMKLEGVDAEIRTIIHAIQKCWYGLDWSDIPIKKVAIYMYQLTGETEEGRRKKYPVATGQNLTVPYLMHRNKMLQEGYEIWQGSVNVPTFRFYSSDYGGSVSVTPCVIGNMFYAKVRDKFKGDLTNMQTIQSFARSGYTYLEILCKCNLNSKTFDGILTDLAFRCLHRDPYAEKTPNFKLFYATATILNNMFSADFLDVATSFGNCPAESPRSTFPVETLFGLLGVLNRTQGLKITSRDLFVRFFSEFVKDKTSDIQKVIDFVSHNGTNVASAEELSAYQHSALGSCEAIQLISQKNPVLAQESGTDETIEEPEEDEGDNIDLSDLPDRDDAEPGLEADEVSEEDQDTSTDDAEGEDDSSSQDGGAGDDNADDSDDDNSSDEGASSGDDDQAADPAGAGDASAGANDTQATATPEDLDASDDTGIVIRISPEGSETVDSVVMREELDAFITDVLTNPPKKLSPQAVSALTTLQRNWIHILSVESITGILEKIISLPDKFKKIKNTHGENS